MRVNDGGDGGIATMPATDYLPKSSPSTADIQAWNNAIAGAGDGQGGGASTPAASTSPAPPPPAFGEKASDDAASHAPSQPKHHKHHWYDRPLGVLQAVGTAGNVLKGVGEGAWDGAKGMAQGVGSLAQGAYGLATSADARQQAMDTAVQDAKAAGQFAQTALTDPGKAAGQVSNAASGAWNRVSTAYQQAAAQGHGAEFIGKAFGQSAVLVGTAVIPGGAEAEAAGLVGDAGRVAEFAGDASKVADAAGVAGDAGKVVQAVDDAGRAAGAAGDAGGGASDAAAAPSPGRGASLEGGGGGDQAAAAANPAGKGPIGSTPAEVPKREPALVGASVPALAEEGAKEEIVQKVTAGGGESGPRDLGNAGGPNGSGGGASGPEASAGAGGGGTSGPRAPSSPAGDAGDAGSLGGSGRSPDGPSGGGGPGGAKGPSEAAGAGQTSNAVLEAQIARNLPQASKAAEPVLARAAEAEKVLTGSVQDVVKETGGDLIGLDHRLKTAKSMTDKIARDMAKEGLSAEEAAANVSDAVRYTASFPPDKLVEGTQVTLSRLQSEGNKVIKLKNTWLDPNDSYM